MAAWSTLTPTQVAAIEQYDLALRGLFASLGGLAKQVNPAGLDAFAVANVDPVTATLDAGTVIPTTSNLAGAQPLVLADFLALQSVARQLMALYNNNITLLVKAVGINSGS